jgi:hypothetical protein
MRHNPARPFPDLSKASTRELIDGTHGIFCSEWIESKEEPEKTANYLVVVRGYEPVIALFIKGLGWDLNDTMHIGLESEIGMWMELPKPQKGEK